MGTAPEPGQDGDPASPDTASLPIPVRAAVLDLASRALGGMAAGETPRSLAAVARFTPAKRARMGAAALTRALDGDPAFRAAVAAALPGLAAAWPTPHDAGASPEDADPVLDAARAFLLRAPDAAVRIERAATLVEEIGLRERVVTLTARVEALTAELAERTSDPTGRRAGAGGRANGRTPTESSVSSMSSASSVPPSSVSSVPGDGEADRLRARLRERGQRVRAAELAVTAARDEVAAAERQVAAVEQLIARERATTQQWRQRAERAEARAADARVALDRMREKVSADRAAADRRIELLLDALQGAATGLRAQWKIATGGPDPADLIAARLPSAPRDPYRAVDPGLLNDWMTLPGAHLIVDGYNVTKTGYGDLALSEQRARLARSLSALAARTSAEVTVVFDGAAVTAPPPAMRGVRVLFSPPGVIADQVVRDLVAAEPAGRVVIVVSSDKEVVDGVRRDGAHTAPSAVLLSLLGP